MTTHPHDRQRKADARIFDRLLKIDAKVALLVDKEFDDIDKRDKESLRQIRIQLRAIAERYGSIDALKAELEALERKFREARQ